MYLMANSLSIRAMWTTAMLYSGTKALLDLSSKRPKIWRASVWRPAAARLYAISVKPRVLSGIASRIFFDAAMASACIPFCE